jgi:hypothetical protein
MNVLLLNSYINFNFIYIMDLMTSFPVAAAEAAVTRENFNKIAVKEASVEITKVEAVNQKTRQVVELAEGGSLEDIYFRISARMKPKNKVAKITTLSANVLFSAKVDVNGTEINMTEYLSKLSDDGTYDEENKVAKALDITKIKHFTIKKLIPVEETRAVVLDALKNTAAAKKKVGNKEIIARFSARDYVGYSTEVLAAKNRTQPGIPFDPSTLDYAAIACTGPVDKAIPMQNLLVTIQ